jgi:hypothetical protein
MPIFIDSVDFNDNFGNSTTFYKANAGDEIEVVFNVRASIRMSSVSNPLILDPSLNTVQSASTGWLDEGFRVGNNVLVYIHSSGGGIINTFWTTIQYVDNVLCDFTAIPNWYNITNGEFVTMYAVNAPNSYNTIDRDGLDLLFNHVKNSSPGSDFSLIDAEVSTINFVGLSTLGIGSSISGVFVGNQSGGFLLRAEVTRSGATSGGFSNWQVRVRFINPGQYDDGTWFFSSECLKIYSTMAWAVIAGEPFARYESVYNFEANTGKFNEANNTSILNSTLISGISELDYCINTDFKIIVDGPVSNLGIGASYKSINDPYYRNRIFPQQEIAMSIATAPAVVGSVVSYENEFAAGYEIVISSITTIGTQTIINATFVPNAEFITFMDGVDDGDRLFYLWVCSGNVNWLAFQGQLTCEPPIGGPLRMVTDWGYLDHSENVQTANGFKNEKYITDTEDDVAYFGTFQLDKNVIYESFSIKFEAFNATTEDDFTLRIINFGFGAVPISGDGRYLLNETAAVVATLPNTSVKLEAFLSLEPSLDTATKYGVKIYTPWLLNWQYWLPQLNASVDFFPTQNRNWEQYDNLGNWILRTELSLIQDGLAYTYANQLINREYNAEEFIDSTIDLIQDSSNSIVNVIPVGSLMRIKSTHINLLEPWDVRTWGMITVESYESSPRWICSTVVPYDNNTSNPLTPLSGLLITIVYLAPNIAVLECYFDPNLIDISNGVKITAKIKGGRQKGDLIDG